MEFFVQKDSIVRRIWGKSDTILFIFAGAAAEFALNKAVDWLYFTGRLPADPLGRLFSTVTYARRIVFSKNEEALKAIEYPGVQSVQIIFNMFRHRPAELFFQEAKRRKVGVLARVPLASGFLSGKYKPGAQFPANDTRANYTPQQLDEKLREVEKIAREEVPAGVPMAQWALAWCLQHPAVTAVIPGAKNAEQVRSNAQAAQLAMVRDNHPQAAR